MPRASTGRAADGREMVHFWCPGCDDAHQIAVGTWSWNGDLDRPTFSPSVLVKGFGYSREPEVGGPPVAPGPKVCHSFVTDGRIQFLGDCTHTLAGQTVDLPEWPHSGDQ